MSLEYNHSDNSDYRRLSYAW